MADKQLELIEKPLHARAVEIARENVDDYAASLIVLAKTLAYQRGDDEVLSTHVLEALNIIQSRRRRKRWKDFSLAIGGALLAPLYPASRQNSQRVIVSYCLLST
jgi:hypothetical protein